MSVVPSHSDIQQVSQVMVVSLSCLHSLAGRNYKSLVHLQPRQDKASFKDQLSLNMLDKRVPMIPLRPEICAKLRQLLIHQTWRAAGRSDNPLCR
ncbi:hypothetical protein BaRGS_00019034 [Batillaria attramentaria]|uniref:Uncharacterized protein n=1 Tax=Batillaria attramentaria TaxID=370345 RepID=A0ABD0KRY1_9CAEN